MDNHVSVSGTTVRDFELRYTSGGTALATGSLAVNRRYQTNGEWTEETSFFDMTLWAAMGENAVASIPKGTRVIVSGRLKQDSWEDRNGGGKRSKVGIVVEDIGPSMKWATAEITKTEREKPAESRPQQRAQPGQDQYPEEPY